MNKRPTHWGFAKSQFCVGKRENPREKRWYITQRNRQIPFQDNAIQYLSRDFDLKRNMKGRWTENESKIYDKMRIKGVIIVLFRLISWCFLLLCACALKCLVLKRAHKHAHIYYIRVELHTGWTTYDLVVNINVYI